MLIPNNIKEKWYSNPKFYDSTKLMELKADDGHSVDIAFIYSGRNRGKSFDIASKALLDAWTSQGKEQFGYARRYEKELTVSKVESYFDDKVAYIQDITDGQCDGVKAYQGSLYFFKAKHVKGKLVRENVLKIGNYFNINGANQYKSMQFPNITRLIFEEVFTSDGYCNNEPRKVLDLISTIKRSRDNFIAYLISNTVSRVNPYADEYALNKLISQKEGTIDTYKLYNGSFDENGKEDYYFIACEYLSDLIGDTGEISKLGTSVLTNKWDEVRLYPTCSIKEIEQFSDSYRCVFQNGVFKFFARIFEVPINFQDWLEDKKITLSNEVMTVAFVTRKTTPYRKDVRLYTTEPIVYPLATRGLYNICDFDKTIFRLIELGQTFYCNNLVACEFSQCYKNLKATSGI